MIHLRETNGKPAELNLTNGINGKPLPVTEVDVIGNAVGNGSRGIGPLESKFFQIDVTP
jgi:hypothetical protein